jgi:Skp family chaperone for outer membrane proteins
MTKLVKSAMLAAVAAASFGTPALAASSSDAGVLVVDFNAVFQNSAAGRSGTQQLQTKYQAQLQQRQQAANAAAQSFETQRGALKQGAPVPAATQTQLQQSLQRAQQAQASAQQLGEEVNVVANYVRQQIIDRAGPVAEQIRAERKASVVISKDAALASDPQADVTTLLVQRLDAAFPTPSIVLPQQGAAPAGARPGVTQGRPAMQGR